MHRFNPSMSATIVTIWLATQGTASAQETSPSPLSDKTPVGVRLATDAKNFRPGSTALVGVVFDLAPHWHIYWKSPRDAGIPPKVKWDLPEGFKAGPLQWPFPKKIAWGEDLLSFGYEDQVVLFSRITAPEYVPEGQVFDVKAHVSWMVCKEMCQMGDSDLALTIPDGPAPATSPSKFLRKHWRRVPTPMHQRWLSTEYKRTEDQASWTITWLIARVHGMPATEVRVFPFDVPEASMGEPRIVEGTERDFQKFTITIPVEIAGTGFDPTRVGALITYQSSRGSILRAGGARGFELLANPGTVPEKPGKPGK